MKETVNEINYEKITERLDEILAQLSKNDLGLEQSMELYEEGVLLYKSAKKILREKEDRAFEIMEELKEEPLTTKQMRLDEMEED